jgi:hypothetical protein
MTTKTIDSLFNEFLLSKDTFRVYKDDRLLFSSQKGGLMPPLEYLGQAAPEKDVIVFDRIVGNAAALLMTLISCKEVMSDLGSEMAIETLDSAGIKHTFMTTVDYIRDRTGRDMCPMEKLSLNKSPEEFRRALKERMQGGLPPARC